VDSAGEGHQRKAGTLDGWRKPEQLLAAQGMPVPAQLCDFAQAARPVRQHWLPEPGYLALARQPHRAA